MGGFALGFLIKNEIKKAFSVFWEKTFTFVLIVDQLPWIVDRIIIYK